eukprot:5103590-Pleurochrysis_carterae.AAC.2
MSTHVFESSAPVIERRIPSLLSNACSRPQFRLFSFTLSVSVSASVFFPFPSLPPPAALCCKIASLLLGVRQVIRACSCGDSSVAATFHPGSLHLTASHRISPHLLAQLDEFINPKYVDAARTAFKSPTRLECMMQARAKTLLASTSLPLSRLLLGRQPHDLAAPCNLARCSLHCSITIP